MPCSLKTAVTEVTVTAVDSAPEPAQPGLRPKRLADDPAATVYQFTTDVAFANSHRCLNCGPGASPTGGKHPSSGRATGTGGPPHWAEAAGGDAVVALAEPALRMIRTDTSRLPARATRPV